MTIVAEMHPVQWPEYRVAPDEVTARLAGLGLRARRLTTGRPLYEQDAHVVLEYL
jgi:hypothetical protein